MLPSQVKNAQNELGDKAWQIERQGHDHDNTFTDKEDIFQQLKADHARTSNQQKVIDLTADDGDEADTANASATAGPSHGGLAGHLQ